MRSASFLIAFLLSTACAVEPESGSSEAVEPAVPEQPTAVGSELEQLKSQLRGELPDVPTISVNELARRLEDGERPLLIDVRAEREYAVSHLAGARRAETVEAAEALLAGEPREREVIVYCSIGYRSGHLAQALRRAGWTNVRNLEGSIFEWANTGHPVWRGDERASSVHPYDAHWGRLLERGLWSELE